jgi:hypothetical protein
MATIGGGATTMTNVNLAGDGRQQPAVQANWRGGVAAAFMACGIGSAAFGATVLAAEASESTKRALALLQGVGPLSGKAVVGSIAYLVAWLTLHLALRRRTVPVPVTLWVTMATLALGFALTFPPIYQALSGQ